MQKRFVIIAALLIAGVMGMWYYRSTTLNVPQAQVKVEAGVTVGKGFSKFSLGALSGETTSVNPSGKITVINFWATWCPPCRAEMPELNHFAEKYRDQVAFYAVNIQEPADKVREFMLQNNYKMAVLLDKDGNTAQLYRISAIPTTLVVDRKGIIVYRKSGAVTMSELEGVVKGL